MRLAPESLVRWLWEGRRWEEPLHTIDGRLLVVIEPGEAGNNAGPDYRQAHLRLAGQLVTGDVEVHVRSGDWHRHRHGGDPAYANVVLHVVLWDDSAPLRRQDGAAIPMVALAPFLEGTWERLLPLAQGAAHPYAGCRPGLARQGEAAALSLLASFGLARLRAKAGSVNRQIAETGPAQSLYAELLAAVALPLPAEEPHRAAAAWPYRNLPSDPGALRSVLQAAWTAHVTPRRGFRPAGAPERRLHVLASLLSGWVGDLVGAAVGLVLAPLTRPNHLEMALCRAGLSAAQATEWATNAILPWAIGWSGPAAQPALAEAAERLFLALPKRQEYGVTRRHAQAIFGPAPAKIDTVAQQQGLLHLERTLCPAGSCPWSERASEGAESDKPVRSYSDSANGGRGTSRGLPRPGF